MREESNLLELARPERTSLAPGAPVALALTDRALIEEVDEYFEAGARVEPGDVVVDVGANVGAFAMRAAERTSGRLPTNSTYDLADKRAEYEAYFFGKAVRIQAFLAAWIPIVGALLGRVVRGVIESLSRRDNRFGVWVADRATGLRVLTCKTESLERWADANDIRRIDLLKIDVEGAELDVLLGCASKWAIIRSVALEAHDRDGRVDAIVSLLSAQGFASIRRLKPRITERTGLDNVILVAHRTVQR